MINWTSYSPFVDAEKISERTRRNQREVTGFWLAPGTISRRAESRGLSQLHLSSICYSSDMENRPRTFTLSAMPMRDGISHNDQHDSRDSPTRSPRMHARIDVAWNRGAYIWTAVNLLDAESDVAMKLDQPECSVEMARCASSIAHSFQGTRRANGENNRSHGTRDEERYTKRGILDRCAALVISRSVRW